MRKKSNGVFLSGNEVKSRNIQNFKPHLNLNYCIDIV